MDFGGSLMLQTQQALRLMCRASGGEVPHYHGPMMIAGRYHLMSVFFALHASSGSSLRAACLPAAAWVISLKRNPDHMMILVSTVALPRLPLSPDIFC
jgi:hypothetical protein